MAQTCNLMMDLATLILLMYLGSLALPSWLYLVTVQQQHVPS